MKVLKQTDDYTVYQKRSGRYAVVGSDKKNINGEDKVKILIAEGIVKQALPAEPEPEVVEDAVEETTEEVAEEAAEEAPEEAPAEEEPAEEATEEEPAAEEPAAEEEAPAEEEPETKE